MKAHRGVSEIVASLVVLVIVSALGVMLYSISLNNMETQQNDLWGNVKLEKEIAQERFEIIDITTPQINEVDIIYMNYGDIDIKIKDVYVDGKLFYSIPAASQHIARKMVINYIVVAQALTPGLHEIRIVSERGVSSVLRVNI